MNTPNRRFRLSMRWVVCLAASVVLGALMAARSSLVSPWWRAVQAALAAAGFVLILQLARARR